jgi:uncharacterized cupredoxin-like copper-binding protein
MTRLRCGRTVVGVMAVVALAACGDDGAKEPTASQSTTSTSAAGPPTTLAHHTDDTASSAPPGALTVGMSAMAFHPSSLTVKAGRVVLFLTNQDPPPAQGECGSAHCHDHSLSLLASSGGLPIATSAELAPGASAVFTIDSLPPGTYSFHCTVMGHAGMGMRGTLDVAP